jgi:glycosyltransferase involved in cell wall biosynthesis
VQTNIPEHRLSYVAITPARNEERYIEKLIQSMIGQTLPPAKWVIVNDGSTDATANIVGKYLENHRWIELLNLSPHRDRSFAAKVHAVNAGLERVKDMQFDVIGNFDSDVSFEADYMEFLLGKFAQDANLGVCGTIFREEGYSSGTDSFEGANHVAGGCQLFRRECFEQIGGYVPNKAGGIDWVAVTTARMKGWTTRSFREKYFFHYRSLGTAERSQLASAFSYGEKDYYLGNHPLWEAFRVAYRTFKKPFVLGSIALLSGYLWALVRRIDRAVSDELMRFHRQEQMKKLSSILKSVLRLKKIDSFEVKPT